jgi:hypothetical protein
VRNNESLLQCLSRTNKKGVLLTRQTVNTARRILVATRGIHSNRLLYSSSPCQFVLFFSWMNSFAAKTTFIVYFDFYSQKQLFNFIFFAFYVQFFANTLARRHTEENKLYINLKYFVTAI